MKIYIVAALILFAIACSTQNTLPVQFVEENSLYKNNIPASEEINFASSDEEIAKEASTSCSDGNGEKCFKLANIFLKDNKKEDAELYFEKACSLKYISGCYEFAKFQIDAKHETLALKYFTYACDNGEIKSCRLSWYFGIS